MADTLQLPIQVKEGTRSPETSHKSGSIVTHTAAACLALSLCVGGEDARAENTSPITSNNNTIVLAQANIEDGRTGPYSAIVPQVNGGTKMVEYYKNKRGLIIPPPVENGKLADGSNAPADMLEAKAEQRSVIAKYVKVVLVKTDKNDIIHKANDDIKKYYELAEEGKLTKEQLFDGFYSVYLIRIGLGNNATEKSIDGFNKIVSGLMSYGKIRLNLQEAEIQNTKQRAEIKAKETLEKFSSSQA